MGTGVLPMIPKQSERFLSGFSEFRSAEDPEILKVSHQSHADKIFQLSRHSVKIIRITEKEKVTAGFCNGLIDRLLKRIYVDHADALCSRDFSCCTIMRPLTNLQVFVNF
jgi:hypothetical protein